METALLTYPNLWNQHLLRIHSDHCPLMVRNSLPLPRVALFKYQRGWEKHDLFLPFVRENWVGRMHDNPLINFALKLKRLRGKLRWWNWNVFGHLDTKISLLREKIESLERDLQISWVEELARELDESKASLYDLKEAKLNMLRDKARMSWDTEGDQNTKFYHAAIKVRQNQNRMALLQQDGTTTSDREVIGNAAVTYYDDLFNGYTSPPPLDVFDHYTESISDEMNSSLCGIPSEDDIYNTVMSMNPDSAPGPDGFSGHFYRTCWHIIKTDLSNAIVAFFRGLQIPTSWSATHLVLLPKIKNPTSITHLRPISLCNFNHKVISHIITKRLANILPSIVGEEQVGFVPGRSMHDNIALAHDLVHDINEADNVVIKLDMAKAYDRMSWTFILRSMRAMGFSDTFCDLIFRSISNCHYSVKWDGALFGFFRSSRGVRQGDPLSPSLFIIAMEWLGKALNNATSDGFLMAYYTRQRALNISHLLYADDILIFSNGSAENLKYLLEILFAFTALSGQS